MNIVQHGPQMFGIQPQNVSVTYSFVHSTAIQQDVKFKFVHY